jgi:hypothetical protein
MQVKPTSIEDLEQIGAWSEIDIDEPHRKISPEWWLTAAPGSYFAGAIDDSEGRVLYFRFDRENTSTLRMHTQFAPQNLVAPRRVAKAICDVLPNYLAIVREVGIDSIIFETKFPELAAFMSRIGFQKAGGDDFILSFAAQAVTESA